MNSQGAVDIFATKGVEYLIVIAFLVILVASWRLLFGRPARAESPEHAPRGRFRIVPGYRYHPGHAWISDVGDGRIRIGIDDFAQRLLGRVTRWRLPEVGSPVSQGDRGWTIDVDGGQVRMLSPVDGTVEAVNPDVERDPGIVNDDPYGRGWLLEVRPRGAARCCRNLMDSRLAALWATDSAEWVARLYTPELGGMLADGGEPIEGFGRLLRPGGWHELAEEAFLSSDLPSW